MNEWATQIRDLANVGNLLEITKAVVLVLIGWLVARLTSRMVDRIAAGRLELQQGTLLRRAVYYTILVLFLIAALHQLGFNLGVLLGAAGVLSVAIGFASQTSASNLVSGLFLIGERPFGVGDVIQVAGTAGEVLSIDLLSVKLRTFDNIYVRIPNETLIKTEVRTLTRFPIRRVDLEIGIGYGEKIEAVRELLYELAERNPLCLDEPRPMFLLLGYGDSAVRLQFSPWTLRENLVEVKSSIQQEILRAFEERGIEIPYPQRGLHAGKGSEPISVRLVEPASDGRSDEGTDDEAT